jgi:hypothetical protein
MGIIYLLAIATLVLIVVFAIFPGRKRRSASRPTSRPERPDVLPGAVGSPGGTITYGHADRGGSNLNPGDFVVADSTPGVGTFDVGSGYGRGGPGYSHGYDHDSDYDHDYTDNDNDDSDDSDADADFGDGDSD